MDREIEISSVMNRFELSEDELETHQKAYYSLSHYGNKKALDAIPQWKRDKIGQFYRALRDGEIYFYNAETGRSQERVGYYEGWVKILRNDPNKPEMRDINIDQVRQFIQNALEEVRKELRLKDRGKGNLGPIVRKTMRENIPARPEKKGGLDGSANGTTAA